MRGVALLGRYELTILTPLGDTAIPVILMQFAHRGPAAEVIAKTVPCRTLRGRGTDRVLL